MNRYGWELEMFATKCELGRWIEIFTISQMSW